MTEKKEGSIIISRERFCRRLRRLMFDRQLSQSELVEKVGCIGYHTINKYVRGVRSPSQKNLRILADYFQVSPRYLAGVSDDEFADAPPDVAAKKHMVAALRAAEISPDEIDAVAEELLKAVNLLKGWGRRKSQLNIAFLPKPHNSQNSQEDE